MNLLFFVVCLFWFQLVVLISLVVFTFHIFRSHKLYHHRFFASLIPTRHVSLVALSFGMLITQNLFLVSQEAAHMKGITHIDALLLRF